MGRRSMWERQQGRRGAQVREFVRPARLRPARAGRVLVQQHERQCHRGSSNGSK